MTASRNMREGHYLGKIGGRHVRLAQAMRRWRATWEQPNRRYSYGGRPCRR
jgi:hypothetical protein